MHDYAFCMVYGQEHLAGQTPQLQSSYIKCLDALDAAEQSDAGRLACHLCGNTLSIVVCIYNSSLYLNSSTVLLLSTSMQQHVHSDTSPF